MAYLNNPATSYPGSGNIVVSLLLKDVKPPQKLR